MSYHASLNSRIAGNIIRKQINKALYGAGIKTATRRGNKELKHLITRMVETPITESTVATQLGDTLGQQIVDLSQEKRENRPRSGGSSGIACPRATLCARRSCRSTRNDPYGSRYRRT